MTTPGYCGLSQGWRKRDKSKADADELKGKLESTEDSLNQALSEVDGAKKGAFEEGYRKGFDAAMANYVEQMPASQDQIWATSWEACLSKVGVADDSPLRVENDLPSSQIPASHDQLEHQAEDVDRQIDDFADAGEGTPTESLGAIADRSPARATINEPVNLEVDTIGVEAILKSTWKFVTEPPPPPPEIQNLD